MGKQRKEQQSSKRSGHGQTKQEMKREVVEDFKAPSLCMSMNLYQSYWPTEIPLILSNNLNHHQELYVKNQDPILDQYPFDTTLNQTRLFDHQNEKSTTYHPQLPNTPYFANGDGINNQSQEFTNYPYDINEFSYNTTQLEQFDGLVGGLDNLINGSNCTSSSAEGTNSWGDPLLCPPPPPPITYEGCRGGVLQNCPLEQPSQFQ